MATVVVSVAWDPALEPVKYARPCTFGDLASIAVAPPAGHKVVATVDGHIIPDDVVIPTGMRSTVVLYAEKPTTSDEATVRGSRDSDTSATIPVKFAFVPSAELAVTVRDVIAHDTWATFAKETLQITGQTVEVAVAGVIQAGVIAQETVRALRELTVLIAAPKY